MSGAEAIAISGVGVVSPLGIGTSALWRSLCAGHSAIAPITRFDPGRGPSHLGAVVPEFPVREFLPPPLVRRMDRLSQMVGVAAVLAVADSGYKGKSDDGDDFGVVVGSALGNLGEAALFLDRLFRKGPGLVNPMLFPNLVMNAAASQIAMALAWRGPNLTISCGEISGEAALETAIDLVRRRRARAVVVAAGEELSEVLFHALSELGYLSPRRRGPGASKGLEGSRPFDLDATGPVLGEGAAALVVETMESAMRRRAKVRAIVERVDRFQLRAPGPHVWPALDAAGERGLPPPAPEADVALCGADSSPERDGLELELLRRLAPRALPIYSLAGAIGTHASLGLCTIAVGAQVLEHGVVPPVVGLKRAPAGSVFPRKPLRRACARALVLGVARGGSAALIELARLA
jgi:3-oxoacyl-[acyl-carrier-protein] synthase II